MATNDNTWSIKPLITDISNTTELCILDGIPVTNKRITAPNLLKNYALTSDVYTKLESDAKSNVILLDISNDTIDRNDLVDGVYRVTGNGEFLLTVQNNIINESITTITQCMIIDSGLNYRSLIVTDGVISTISPWGRSYDITEVYNKAEISTEIGNAIAGKANSDDVSSAIANSIVGLTSEGYVSSAIAGAVSDMATISYVSSAIEGKANSVDVYTKLESDARYDNSNGSSYTMVYGTGTEYENGDELKTAYNIAKTMPRFIGAVNRPGQGELLDKTIYAGQTFFWDDGSIDGVYLFSPATQIDYSGDDVIGGGDFEIITELQAKSVKCNIVIAPGVYYLNPLADIIETNILLVSLGTVIIKNEGVVLTVYLIGSFSIVDPTGVDAIVNISRIVGNGSFEFEESETRNGTRVDSTSKIISNGQYIFTSNVYSDKDQLHDPVPEGVVIGTRGHGVNTLIKGDYLFLSDDFNGNNDGTNVYEIQHFTSNAAALVASEGKGGMMYTDSQGNLKLTYTLVP